MRIITDHSHECFSARERLPSLYRAQFLVYMACSEEDGDNTKMLERIEDAQYWIDDIDVGLSPSQSVPPY